jgi:hypothetical protein
MSNVQIKHLFKNISMARCFQIHAPNFYYNHENNPNRYDPEKYNKDMTKVMYLYQHPRVLENKPIQHSNKKD